MSAAAVAEAEQRLHRALMEGRDTAAVHADIARLRDSEDRERRAADDEARRQAADAAGTRAAEVGTAAERVRAEARQRLRDLPGHSGAEDATEPDLCAVDAAAAALAEAEVEVWRASGLVREAEAEAGTARARQQELYERRRALGERRAAGDRRGGDAAEAGLLAADIEALDNVLARSDAVVAKRAAQARQSVSRLDAARVGLGRAEAEVASRALVARAERHAEALADVLSKLRAAQDAKGGGVLPWVPPMRLQAAIVAAANRRSF